MTEPKEPDWGRLDGILRRVDDMTDRVSAGSNVVVPMADLAALVDAIHWLRDEDDGK